MRPIIVDLAEFMGNPVRSGIQRVVRELVNNWPRDVSVRYARYDSRSNRLVHIPHRVLRRAIEYRLHDHISNEAFSASIAHDLMCSGHKPLDVISTDRVLVPELFYGQERVKFYRESIRNSRMQPYFIVYDFIPWLKPEEVAVGSFSAGALMPYLLLITEAQDRCFISAAVKDEFVQRVTRKPGIDAGPVIKLGSDGIKVERQIYNADRRDLVCIGTLDGKKRQEIAFNAFLKLQPGRRGRFVCLGKISPQPAPWMRELLNCRLEDVEIIDSPSDDLLAMSLRKAKATVFISTNEGFGLPAVESLFCGIPLIAYDRLPSLTDLPSDGQIRLSSISSDTVAQAFERLADDVEVERLWAAIDNLNLLTWREYAVAIVAWLTNTDPPSDNLKRAHLVTARSSATGSDEDIR